MKKLYVVAALLALVGLADALYLTIEHVTGQSVRCTIISGCSAVLSSPYAVVAGMPLERTLGTERDLDVRTLVGVGPLTDRDLVAGVLGVCA